MAGMNRRDPEQLYSFGYGLGTELSMGKHLSLNPELTSQYLYLGNWENLNLLNKLHLNLNIKFGKYFSIFGGPSFAAYYTDQQKAVIGYRFQVPPPSYKTFEVFNNMTGWFGWNAGINFF